MAIRYSQNGWPAYAVTDNYVRAASQGFAFWAANRDVAIVLGEFIRRFDLEVEEIDGPVRDDWSYANRLVRGSTSTISNHGSATAIDLNALKHPRGVRNTFSTAQQKRMHQIRDAIADDSGHPVLRLGMDFQSTVDDMHVEINANATRVKEAADRIRGEDIMVTKAELEVLLLEILSQRRTVENLPVDKDVVQGRNWTLTEVLAAGDRKLDLLRREQARQATVLDGHTANQRAILAAIGTLSAGLAQKASAGSINIVMLKIDELIKAVSALAPPPTP